MQINLFAIPVLVSSILLFCFGVFIFNKDKKSILNKLIALWCLAGFIWLFSYSLCYMSKSESLAEVFARIGCIGVMFLAVFPYHFVVTLLELKAEKRFVYAVYFINILLIPFFLFTNYLLSSGSYKYFYGYYGKAGNFYLFYIIFFFLILVRVFFILYKKLRDKSLSFKKRIQIKYIFLGFFIASVASVDFLPKFGIKIYPFGFIFMLLWVSIIYYAIFKHQLMDITIVLQKGLIYSILIAVITIIYLIFVFFIEKFFQNVFGYRSILISFIYALIIAIFFIPLKNKIQSFIDKIFLGKTPEQIVQENELLRQELLRSEKLKAVGTFASGMAHEIKNPLTAIKTFAEYLPQNTEDKEFLSKFSKIVGSEVEKIDNLVHQLLDFSKPAPLQLKETDIHKLLDDTIELLSSQFIKYNIKVIKDYCTDEHRLKETDDHRTDISDNLPIISDNLCLILKVDPNQMKQVFLNLFLNSIEAMPNGGTLTVSTNLCSSSGKESALICVSDTGYGISEKDLSHIFEPFYSTKEKGTGLGLSIVYNIIKEHNGIVKVESKLDEGTKFIVELMTE